MILGTPTEDDWDGVTHLPGYKNHKLGFYRGQKLGLSFPRLYDIMEGESMASALPTLCCEDLKFVKYMREVFTANCQESPPHGEEACGRPALPCYRWNSSGKTISFLFWTQFPEQK
uniref:Uncharacterized protein n=1 Tax=Timema bartmani TaxID=61472 RepID=A0A7R9F160_9NEOP|nr:unnamed protein product [Timema bartmani]